MPDEPRRLLLVLGYPSMAEAADAVPGAARRLGRWLDWSPARAWTPGSSTWCGPAGSAVPELPRGAGWLFVEVAGDDAAGRWPVGWSPRPAALGSRVVTDPAEAAALWRIREDGAGLAARSLPTPAYSGWEDAAVPPERLGAWLRDFDELLREHGLDGVPYGHFGDGCVHVRIDFALRRRRPARSATS